MENVNRTFLIAAVDAAHREGQGLVARYQGDSRQLIERLTGLLRGNKSARIGDIRKNLNECFAFLSTWISALEGYCSLDADDDRWKRATLDDWRGLRAKIEEARGLLDARASISSRS